MYPDSKDIVDCFNSKSHDDLAMLEHLNVTWRPSRDQEWIKDDFLEDFKILGKDVDVMVGNTAGDSVLFAAYFPGSAGLYETAGDFMNEISLNPENEQNYSAFNSFKVWLFLNIFKIIFCAENKTSF